MVNGRGPVRLVVDTGGSVALTLHTEVAEELGLKSIAPAYVRGIGGLEESGQALVDELSLGEIKVGRVMTRLVDLSGPLTHVADGVLGTGVLAGGRVTFDLAGGRLRVEASRAEAPAGEAVPLWLVGDMKLLTPVEAGGRPATALLDTGADLYAYSPTLLGELFEPDRLQRMPMANAVGVGEDAQLQLWTCPPVELEWGGRRLGPQAGFGVEALDHQIGPIIGAQPQVLLGMPLIRQLKSMTVDYPAARLWVQWAAPGDEE
jgi:predicted aspartyl protease